MRNNKSKQTLYIILGLILTLVGVWGVFSIANLATGDKDIFTAMFGIALIGMFIMGAGVEKTQKK